MQQVLRLAQGNAQVGAAVAGQQTRPRTNVRTGQFQVAAALAGLLTAAAAVDVPAVAMPLDFRFRDVGDEMVVEGPGAFAVGRATMGTLVGMNVVFDEDRPGGRFLPKGTGVLAMLLAAAVGGRASLGGTFALGPLAALVDWLELVLHVRQAPPQLSVFCLQRGVFRLKLQESQLHVQDE